MRNNDKVFFSKEELVIEFIRLGMDFHTACLAAEISEDEEDILTEDESFLRKVSIENAMLERTLLARHDKACEIAEKRGSTSGVQWKLEKINPARYSNHDKSDSLPIGKININFIRGKAEEQEQE